MMPASASTSPRSGSKSSTRSSPVMSRRSSPPPNCCPPMAWRPPAMAMARPAARAASTATQTSATDVGRRTRGTRVALSWAWTSLTSISRSVIAEDSATRTTRAPGDGRATRPSLAVGYTLRVGLLPATWWARPLKGSSMAEFTAEQARENLKNVFDPEIGINIVDLGLVYDVDVSDKGDVLVTMTLTSLGCPLGPVIVQEVTNAMSELPNLGDVDVKLVWSPAWSPDMMSEDARDELGIW